MKRLIDVIILFSVLINCFISGVHSQEVTESCLQCICKASSGCKLNTKCHNSGPNAYFCGPYQISWAYWADAGKPGNTGGSADFEHCLNDKNCAEVAVRGYMTKWQKDCNNDGVIDCLDFAAIHKAGASSCDQQWLYNSQYWNVFRQCQISASDPSSQPALNTKPWAPSQPQNNPQVYPNSQPSDPWPQSRPQPRPSLKPIPKPSNSYNPQPASDPWNSPQPQPQPDPYNPPQPTNDDDESWDPPQPQPRPSLRPASQPANSYNPSQPAEDPWNQPQPSTDDSWDPQPPQPQSQPQPSRPQSQPYPNDDYTASQPQPRPSLKPQPNTNYGQPQPDPDYNQPQPVPDYNQPQPTDSWISDQPSDQTYPGDPYNFGNHPVEDDPWDAVSRAVDELSQPSPRPQNQPQPQGNPSDPWNADPPSPQPQPIPGRAPVQPVSWSTTSPPTNSFSQPLSPQPVVPTIGGNTPNSQPSPTFIEVSELPINGSVDANCLECICQASSDCDLNKQCEGSYCGPYLISWAYWSDAGQPGGDYVTCSTEKGCSQQAVKGYMNKWQRDCNGDGLIDCTDFAAIHKLGPHSCGSEAIHGTDYWTSYQSCKSPTIDARRLPADQPTSAALTGRSVPQSGPSVNLFQEYPSPSYNNPTPVERNSNPVTREAPNYFARDSRIIFPTERGQPNEYGDTSGPTKPFRANNLTNDKSFEALGLNRECLDCICQASSRCNADIGCQNDGSGGYLCGAYQMSWAHWSDAGKPGIRGNLENLENFQSCLNNKDCAEATLYGYLRKWKKDCNEDQQINCNDFAALHKAGPSNCGAQWFLESQYWSDFRECFDFRRKK